MSDLERFEEIIEQAKQGDLTAMDEAYLLAKKILTWPEDLPAAPDPIDYRALLGKVFAEMKSLDEDFVAENFSKCLFTDAEWAALRAIAEEG